MKSFTAKTLFAIIATCALISTSARAQHFGTNWDGGSGTWNATNTNWDGTNAYFNSNDRTNIAVPVFSGAGGTITVDESGGPLYNGIMVFNSGTWTLNGDALNSVSTDYQAQVLVMNGGSGNVTVNNTINIAPNPTNGGSVFIDYATGTTMKLGNINISSIPQSGTDGTGTHYSNVTAPFTYNNGNQTYTVNSQTPLLFATNGTTIEIDGNYTTDPGLVGGLLIGNYGDAGMATGTYIFKGALNENINGGKQFDFGSGNILFETSQTGTGPMVFVGAGANLLQTLETVGNQTISNNIQNQGASNAKIGVSDNGTSTFSGYNNVGGGGGELDLYANTGGTAIFSGQIDGDMSSTTKDGAGTVVLSHANTFSSYQNDVFEAKAGTTLIKNTSGDAFGNGINGNASGTVKAAPAFVQIDAGATLGGSGITAINVHAAGATTVIAPGAQATSATTLHLNGGLTATSGLTMNFTLYGTANDSVDFGGFPNINVVGAQPTDTLNLTGLVTINLTGTPTINSSNNGIFKILTGLDLGASSLPLGDGLSFNINAPAGYQVVDFGSMSGSQTGDDYIYVQLAAVPEPSTYALLGLGLLGLVAIRRFRRLSA